MSSIADCINKRGLLKQWLASHTKADKGWQEKKDQIKALNTQINAKVGEERPAGTAEKKKKERVPGWSKEQVKEHLEARKRALEAKKGSTKDTDGGAKKEVDVKSSRGKRARSPADAQLQKAGEKKIDTTAAAPTTAPKKKMRWTKEQKKEASEARKKTAGGATSTMPRPATEGSRRATKHLRCIVVKGLPRSFTQEDLRALCEPLGEIESCKLRNPTAEDAEDGSEVSTAAFVKFCEISGATNAIDTLDGKRVESSTGEKKRIAVDYSLHKKEGEEAEKMTNQEQDENDEDEEGEDVFTSNLSKQPEGDDDGMPQPVNKKVGMFTSTPAEGAEGPEILRNLIVNNLPKGIDEAGFKRMFEPHGALESIKLMVEGWESASKGYGFVKYLKASDAAKAIAEVNGKLDGCGGKMKKSKIKVAYAKKDDSTKSVHPRKSVQEVQAQKAHFERKKRGKKEQVKK